MTKRLGSFLKTVVYCQQREFKALTEKTVRESVKLWNTKDSIDKYVIWEHLFNHNHKISNKGSFWISQEIGVKNRG